MADTAVRSPETVDDSAREAMEAVVRAAVECRQRLGRDRVTMDDVCDAAGISRATLYRLFPGGRDVLFEAVREHSLREFFGTMRSDIEDADSLEELLVRVIVVSSCALRDDEHLAASLATEPGSALGDLTFDGLERIIRVATEFIQPFAARFTSASSTTENIDILARLVISYHLSPSKVFDFTKKASAARFVRTHLLPAIA
jgi:AcrR family transcriptional regulator